MANRLFVALLLVTGCAGAQSEDDRFRSALAQTPPMVNPALSNAVDPAVSSSWDSTYRMLSFSPAEACFLAEWDVPAQLAPAVRFQLEGWRSLDEERRAVPSVGSRSMEILDGQAVARIKANDPPVKDDVPPEIRALRPALTPMRVCFAPSVIRAGTRYLVIRLEVDESNGRHHETGAGWRLVSPHSTVLMQQPVEQYSSAAQSVESSHGVSSAGHSFPVQVSGRSSVVSPGHRMQSSPLQSPT